MRCSGSHIVGSTPLDFLQTTPFGPTLFRPMPVGGDVFGPVPTPGIGPRELPSHSSQPTAQPLLNQKQAWPFWPVMVPFCDGTGHQPVLDSTFGGCDGGGLFHGCRSRSTALRGLRLQQQQQHCQSPQRDRGARRWRGRSGRGAALTAG